MRKSGIGPWVQPVITGKDLAHAAVEDFARFFRPECRIKIGIEIAGFGYAAVKGKLDRLRIVISPEMANELIISPEILFFHLFILGHEIAHAVQLHNDDRWQEAGEYKSLEMWADFYGAKVMMCLITFGSVLSPVFRQFFPLAGLTEEIEYMGKAAGLLATHVYNINDRYPHPLSRVAFITNGIQSFFRAYMKKQPDILPFSVYRRMFASKAVRDLMTFYSEKLDEAYELTELARKWHINKQGKKAAIAPGLKHPIAAHLHTSFRQTIEEFESRRKERERELIESGLVERSESGELRPGKGPQVLDNQAQTSSGTSCETSDASSRVVFRGNWVFCPRPIYRDRLMQSTNFSF